MRGKNPNFFELYMTTFFFRLETDVVISGARIKGKKVFSSKSSTLLETKAELDLGLAVKVGGKKLPKHPKGKAEAPKVVKESEESEEEER
jgi:hypothetical protein